MDTVASHLNDSRSPIAISISIPLPSDSKTDSALLDDEDHNNLPLPSTPTLTLSAPRSDSWPTTTSYMSSTTSSSSTSVPSLSPTSATSPHSPSTSSPISPTFFPPNSTSNPFVRTTLTELQSSKANLAERIERLTARLSALSEQTNALHSATIGTSALFLKNYKRLNHVEDFMLRLQGKPGLSEAYLENGPQPRRLTNDLEELKMGVKTLRRKFQAAGNAVVTAGWWRHLAVNTATATAEQQSQQQLPPQDHHQQQQQQQFVTSPESTKFSPTRLALSPTTFRARSGSSTTNLLLSPTDAYGPQANSSDEDPILADRKNSGLRANPALGLRSPPPTPKAVSSFGQPLSSSPAAATTADSKSSPNNNNTNNTIMTSSGTLPMVTPFGTRERSFSRSKIAAPAFLSVFAPPPATAVPPVPPMPVMNSVYTTLVEADDEGTTGRKRGTVMKGAMTENDAAGNGGTSAIVGQESEVVVLDTQPQKEHEQAEKEEDKNTTAEQEQQQGQQQQQQQKLQHQQHQQQQQHEHPRHASSTATPPNDDCIDQRVQQEQENAQQQQQQQQQQEMVEALTKVIEQAKQQQQESPPPSPPPLSSNMMPLPARDQEQRVEAIVQGLELVPEQEALAIPKDNLPAVEAVTAVTASATVLKEESVETASKEEIVLEDQEESLSPSPVIEIAFTDDSTTTAPIATYFAVKSSPSSTSSSASTSSSSSPSNQPTTLLQKLWALLVRLELFLLGTAILGACMPDNWFTFWAGFVSAVTYASLLVYQKLIGGGTEVVDLTAANKSFSLSVSSNTTSAAIPLTSRSDGKQKML